jgi:hypothetical protein
MPEQARTPRIEPRDGGPDMVQLVTPEGERVSDERFDPIVDGLTHEDIQGFYRDMVLVRRIDNEATALQRQGELGLWAPCLGQEAAQVGSGRALRRRTSPSRPIASTASPGAAGSTRSTCSGCSAACTTAAGTRSRRTSISTRSSSAPRRCTRPATPWASSAIGAVGTGDPGPRHGRHRLLRRRGHRPGRCRRGVRLRRRQQLRRSSSSARTTSGPSPSPTSADPHPALPARARASASPALRVDGNDVLACMP